MAVGEHDVKASVYNWSLPRLDLEEQLNGEKPDRERVIQLVRQFVASAAAKPKRILYVLCWERNKRVLDECLPKLAARLKDEKGCCWRTHGGRPVTVQVHLKQAGLLGQAKATGRREPGEEELFTELDRAYNHGS